MTTSTPNLGLVLYNSTTDQAEYFSNFRAVIAGVSSTSNFYKIDTAYGNQTSQIASLQLTRGAIYVPATFVSANYYEASGISEITSYTNNMTIILELDTSSSGTVTLNINSLGTKSVVKINSSGSVANMVSGELMIGKNYLFRYDLALDQWIWVSANSADQIYVVGGSVGNILTVDSNGNISGSTTRSSLLISQVINGMAMSWNSVNSISIGTGSCYAENGDFIDLNSALTASSLSLSNSTWYHVYAYLSSGTPSVEVTTTAPVIWKGTAYTKTGDTSRRYMGSVKTDTSGGIYQFKHNTSNGLFLYANMAINTAPFRCLTSGVATSATSVDLSSVIPITINTGWVRVINTADSNSYIGLDSTVSTSRFQIAVVSGNVVQLGQVLFLPVSSAQAVYYFFSSTPSVGGMNIDVYGYVMER